MLKDFKKIIRECEYSNTYKMAWAKAIIELSNKYFDTANEYNELSLFDLCHSYYGRGYLSGAHAACCYFP